MYRFNFNFHQGKRKEPVSTEEKKKAKFYHIRSSGGILAKRVIQVKINLYSCFPLSEAIMICQFSVPCPLVGVITTKAFLCLTTILMDSRPCGVVLQVVIFARLSILVEG